MRFLGTILVNMLAVLVAAWILPDGIQIEDNLTALIAALVIGVLNGMLKPILVVLTIPFTIVTFGLFLLVINAGMILLTDYFVDGFEVTSFWYALLFSLILSVLTSIVNKAKKDGKKDRQRR
jgi:putative membrane protein